MRRTDVTVTTGTVEIDAAQSIETGVNVTTEVVSLLENTEVADDGSYAATAIVESYDVTVAKGSPIAEEFAAEEELGALEGIALSAEFDADRRPLLLEPTEETTLSPEQQEAIDELFADLENGSILTAFPDQPIGTGATWTGPVPLGESTVPAEFELVSLVDGEYAVEFSHTADAAVLELPERFDTAAGTVTMIGTMSGDVDDPLAEARSVTLTFDVTFSGPEGELVLDLTTEIEQTTEAG